MKELKEFTVNLEAERNSFSGGEVLQGSILAIFNEPAEMRNIKVQFYGEAICRWDRVHGSKDGGKNGSKQPKADEVVKLQKVLFGVKDGESPESIPVHPEGEHRYDFKFNLPNYLPCSFESPRKRESGLAYIRYFVTATITRPWRSDITRRKAVNIDEIIDTSLPEYAYRPGCQTQKQLGTCFSDGLLSIQAYLDQICYRPEETILISAVAENDTQRIMSSVFAKLFRRTRYYRKHQAKTYHDVVAEYFGERVLPKEFVRWENLEFKIPAVSPSITKSKRIRVDYFLRVGMYQLFRDEIHVDLPIVIGTTIEFFEKQQSQQKKQILALLPAEIRASLTQHKENEEVANRQQLEDIADIFMQMPYTGKRPSVQYISAVARKNLKQGSAESTPRRIGSDESEPSLYGDEKSLVSRSANFVDSGYYNEMGYLSPTSNLSSRRASETSIHVPSRQDPQQNRLSSSLRLSPQRRSDWTPTQSANATPRDANDQKQAYHRILKKAKSQSHIKQTDVASTAPEKSSAGLSPRKASPAKRPTMRKAASQGTIDMKAAAQVAAGLGSFKNRRSMKIKTKEDSLNNTDTGGFDDKTQIVTATASPQMQQKQKIDAENLKKSASYSSPGKTQARPIIKDSGSLSEKPTSPMKRPTVRKSVSQGAVDMKTVAQVAASLDNVKRKGAVKIKGKNEKLNDEVKNNVDSSEPNEPKQSPSHQGSKHEVNVTANAANTDSIKNAAEKVGSTSNTKTRKKEEDSNKNQRKTSRRSTSKAPDMSPIAGSQQSSPVKETVNFKSHNETRTKASPMKAVIKQATSSQSKSLNSASNRDIASAKKVIGDTKAKKQLTQAGNRLSAVKAFAGPAAKGKHLNSSQIRPSNRSVNSSNKPTVKGTTIGKSISPDISDVAKGNAQESSADIKSSTQKSGAYSQSVIPNSNTKQPNPQASMENLSSTSQVEVNNNLENSTTGIESTSSLPNNALAGSVAASKSGEISESADIINNNTMKATAVEDEIIPATEDVNLQRTPSLDHFELLENDLRQSDASLEASTSGGIKKTISSDVDTDLQVNKQSIDEEEIFSVEQVSNLERAPSLDEFEKFEEQTMLVGQMEEENAIDDVNLEITLLKSNNSPQVADDINANVKRQSTETRTERRLSRVTVVDIAGNTLAKMEEIVDIKAENGEQEGDTNLIVAHKFIDNQSREADLGVAENDVTPRNLGVGSKLDGEMLSGYNSNQVSVKEERNVLNDSFNNDDDDDNTLAADISQDHISTSSKSSTHDLTRGFYTPPEFIDDDSADAAKLTDTIIKSNDSVYTTFEGGSAEIKENGVATVIRSEIKDENENKAPSKANVFWKETIAKVRKNQTINQPGRRRSVVNIRVTNQDH